MTLEINNKYKKTLNRNPFNEKLIHRYYIESLYFNAGMKKSLLPPRLQKLDVLLIVPEDSSQTNTSGYRPDFSIYFKGIEKAYPVEVKWTTKEFNKDHQVDFIEKNEGFLVALKNNSDTTVDSIIIDVEDFQLWLAKNIYNLSFDSLSSKDVLDSSNQSWLVCSRGTSIENFLRMMNSTKKSFWAFQNKPKILERMFQLSKNDSMLFIFFKSPEDKGMSLMINPKKKNERDLIIKGWVKVTIKEPYYLCLEGEQSQFFEKLSNGDSTKISERKWVNFFDFRIEESSFDIEYDTTSLGWDSALVESYNTGGGTLVPIDNSLSNKLFSELLTSKKQSLSLF